MKHLLSRTVLSLSILVTVSAYAARGYITEDAYIYAGPDTGYPSVAMLGAGNEVVIEGCVNGWSWCDVATGDSRGWVQGYFLQDEYNGERVMVPQYGVQSGIPIISFVFGSYWDNHYRNRPWYSERTRWNRVQPRYQRDNAHGNSGRSSYGNSHAVHDSSRPTVFVTAPANPARTIDHATPQHQALGNAGTQASRSDRTRPDERGAVAASPRDPATRGVAQHAGTQLRTAVRQHAAAQPKGRPAKSKSEKKKHPDSSGQQ